MCLHQLGCFLPLFSVRVKLNIYFAYTYGHFLPLQKMNAKNDPITMQKQCKNERAETTQQRSNIDAKTMQKRTC